MGLRTATGAAIIEAGEVDKTGGMAGGIRASRAIGAGDGLRVAFALVSDLGAGHANLIAHARLTGSAAGAAAGFAAGAEVFCAAQANVMHRFLGVGATVVGLGWSKACGALTSRCGSN